MTGGPVGVAIVGAGVISQQYLQVLGGFPDVRVVGIADLDVDRAKAAAAEWDVPLAGDVDTVLAAPEVEVVVNLTVPAAHAEVARAAIRAGKHVYGEKPLCLDPAEGASLLDEAAAAGVRVGNAPDTFLGAGVQSALRALASGAIGTPVSVATAVMNFGPERWHPSPEFLFQYGAGPLYDVGPYYLTALVSMFGPVSRVAALTRTGRPSRTIGSGPRAGTVFDVEVPTHVTALADFTGGPSAASTFSFDSALPRTTIEIVGTEGALSVPDPNKFDGRLLVRAPGDEDWRDLPVTGSSAGRGLGVLDLARALRTGEPHRADGALALHVLDVMATVVAAAERGTFLDVAATAERPAPVPEDWAPEAATL